MKQRIADTSRVPLIQRRPKPQEAPSSAAYKHVQFVRGHSRREATWFDVARAFDAGRAAVGKSCYFHNDKRTGCPLCNGKPSSAVYPKLPAGSNWPPAGYRQPLSRRSGT